MGFVEAIYNHDKVDVLRLDFGIHTSERRSVTHNLKVLSCGGVGYENAHRFGYKFVQGIGAFAFVAVVTSSIATRNVPVFS